MTDAGSRAVCRRRCASRAGSAVAARATADCARTDDGIIIRVDLTKYRVNRCSIPTVIPSGHPECGGARCSRPGSGMRQYAADSGCQRRHAASSSELTEIASSTPGVPAVRRRRPDVHRSRIRSHRRRRRRIVEVIDAVPVRCHVAPAVAFMYAGMPWRRRVAGSLPDGGLRPLDLVVEEAERTWQHVSGYRLCSFRFRRRLIYGRVRLCQDVRRGGHPVIADIGGRSGYRQAAGSAGRYATVGDLVAGMRRQSCSPRVTAVRARGGAAVGRRRPGAWWRASPSARGGGQAARASADGLRLTGAGRNGVVRQRAGCCGGGFGGCARRRSRCRRGRFLPDWHGT